MMKQSVRDWYESTSSCLQGAVDALVDLAGGEWCRCRTTDFIWGIRLDELDHLRGESCGTGWQIRTKRPRGRHALAAFSFDEHVVRQESQG